jgi:catechol 2,3-dioxygenase-like lactoylglutathione lyase family enzyme
MLSDSRIVAFVASSDPERARAFYEGVLGLKLLRDEEYALIFDANGTTLRLQKVETVAPAPYTVLGWVVADIHSEMDALAARGIVFERFEGMPQDERGICTFPGGGMVAWFNDPDGNLLSLTQFG